MLSPVRYATGEGIFFRNLIIVSADENKAIDIPSSTWLQNGLFLYILLCDRPFSSRCFHNLRCSDTLNAYYRTIKLQHKGTLSRYK